MFYRTHLKELLRRKSEFQIDTFDAIRFILEENLDLYESIITLYKKGHIQACLLVARPIVENNINLQYILQKDTEKRARNFILQSTHYLLNGLKYSEDSFPGKEEMMADLERIEGEIDKSGSKKNCWDGKSFKDMCDELGQSKVYELWYRRLSKYIHSQYRSIRSFEKEGPYNDFMKNLLRST